MSAALTGADLDGASFLAGEALEIADGLVVELATTVPPSAEALCRWRADVGDLIRIVEAVRDFCDLALCEPEGTA